MDDFISTKYKKFNHFMDIIYRYNMKVLNFHIITNTNLIWVLWPKDVLRTKNSVIAVFPCVSEKNFESI